MTTLRVKIIEPEARKDEETTLFISRGICRVGNESVNVIDGSARREGDDVFLQEDNGDVWRFKVIERDRKQLQEIPVKAVKAYIEQQRRRNK